jgi:hypothetical protein
MSQQKKIMSIQKYKFAPVSYEEEAIGKAIVNAAFIVHKELGPGLLEKVYEACFCHVLTKKDFLLSVS